MDHCQSHDGRRRLVEEALRQVEAWLPHQGPIGVFIHRNTLSAFEDQKFWEAVEDSAQVRGARPYMPHSWYLDALQDGRIDMRDCEEFLVVFGHGRQQDKDPALAEADVRRAALLVPRMMTSDQVVRATMESESHFIQTQSGTAPDLWSVICAALRTSNFPLDDQTDPQLHGARPLRAADEALIQLASTFLDGGVAHWPMPERHLGFFNSIRMGVIGTQLGRFANSRWFDAQAKRVLETNQDPISAILAVLDLQGLETANCLEILRQEALALPGWAGTFAVIGHNLTEKLRKTNLGEFLAVRLLLGISQSFREDLGFTELSPRPNPLQRLWHVREVSLVLQRMGVSARVAESWTKETWTRLSEVLSAFGDVQRRRCLHQAYERHYLLKLLGGLKANRSQITQPSHSANTIIGPLMQAVFCIDEREESLRRCLEEVDSEIETFGAAGFFGMDMLFKSAADSEAVPLCPPVIQPKHMVIEHSRHIKEGASSSLVRFVHESSRHFLGGAVLSQVAGIASLIPLASRVLLPGLGGQHLREALPTDLEIEFSGVIRSDGIRVGYTVLEMADRVEGILRGMGLIQDFAPLVALVGHGSQSLNNPHESAHDCGACGGRRGAANTRVFAKMANHPDVRQELLKRGLAISERTWFVGAYHDTCSDQVSFFDAHIIPQEFMIHFEEKRRAFDRARALNASERCRRFSRGNRQGPDSALRHVSFRCADLREPRPEYGHATNAALVVGRRDLTRGLFLDRRAFLLSYNPAQDRNGLILGRLIGAVIPVCAGISLEYYFSYVDNEKYGCGTKLPHNVVGLMGVMNGRLSDLRTGLPLQMVEIHEPMRLAVVIESTTDIVSNLLAAQPNIARLVDNEWIQLQVFDASTGLIQRRVNGKWSEFHVQSSVLARIPRSIDYTYGATGFLSPVAISGVI